MAARLTRLDAQGEVRVEDYLDDKLQTAADLQNLNSLLETVRNQQNLLKQQLSEAEDAFGKAARSSNDHGSSVKEKTEAFTKRQADIDRRLLIITQSETSDDAVRKFEASMEKLRRLDIAKGYVELLTEVDKLKKEALENIEKSPRSGLPAYSRLRALASALKEAQPAAEGAAPHLVDHVDKTATALFQQMRKKFSESLEKTLEEMHWPSKDLNLTDDIVDTWADQVGLLLDLQEPDIKALNAELESSGSNAEPVVLLPLEVMAHPLMLRFKYHFNGNKPTNRLDKPEYFLSHIIDLLSRHCDFFMAYLQPLLDDRAASSGLDVDWVYADATSAFITALLPMVRQKTLSLLPQISDHPQLLSHFMHELMNFDTEIKDDWAYSFSPTVDWKGLTWEVLVKHEWFDHWLQVEKDFAFSRYRAIIDTPDSGEIDHDGVDPGATKPTKAAIRVNDLLETITDRYRSLSSFSQKLRFLIDVQITIFDKFHERLHSGLEAYMTMTSTLGRTVQGASGRDGQTDLSGVSGLERLCRIFGSAEYLEKKMRDWSDDVFFLDLWAELQVRARAGPRLGEPGTIAGSMTVSSVASRTSNMVADGGHESTADSGALFDETAAAYHSLRTRSEGTIISTLTYSTNSSLRRYSRLSTWSSLSSTSASLASVTPSSELDGPLSTLLESFKYLSSVLAPAPLRRITRAVLNTMQNFLWDNVLMRNSFSAAGAAQFARDVGAICDVVDGAVGGRSDEAKRGMRKLREACALLTLPVRASRVDQDPASATAESEIGGGADSDAPDQKSGTDSDRCFSLWDVERRVFRDNDSAREVLREMGLDSVSQSDARAVLEKRVEVGA